MVKLLATALIVSSVCLATVSSQANRAKVCQKAVNLGVTFYTAKELEPILQCIEPTLYNTPEDTDTLISINGCTDLMALIDKLTKPFMNQCKQVINKGLKVLNNCKANNKKTGVAKQNACINKVYGQCMAMVTKAFINKVCTALSKKMTAKEWNCCKQYAPKVVNVTPYKCYQIEK
ncbi:hypothetical protein CAEBREN_06819 [Caenorhabditis brenneri]|uniref:Uncharacterized protein n=1 Tax=Caenorhabditis brenneri TaxID=135651 RepID=G0NBL6_CAEBE|nr:hypothetical protein CAEBREN_06819 [Caenorhabditis brenneri]